MLSWFVAQIHATNLNSSNEDVRRYAAEQLYRLMVRGNSTAARILLNRLWDPSLHLFVQWGMWRSGINTQKMVEFYLGDLARPQSFSEFEDLIPRFRFFPESHKNRLTSSPEAMNGALRTHASSALSIIGEASIVPLRSALERAEFVGMHKHEAETMAAEILYALGGLPPGLQTRFLPNGPRIDFHLDMFQ